MQALWEFLYRGDRIVDAAIEVFDNRQELVGLEKVSSRRPRYGGGDEAWEGGSCVVR